MGCLLRVQSLFYVPGIFMWMCPANERWRYIVTSTLIGWAHTQNDPCVLLLSFSTVYDIMIFWTAPPTHLGVYTGHVIFLNNMCTKIWAGAFYSDFNAWQNLESEFTMKWLHNFSSKWILDPKCVLVKGKKLSRHRYYAINIETALWMLIAWCFSNRSSAAIKLTNT